jgi:multidrug efflux pump subunit AcrA (membrane-fusion protein)
MKKWVLVGVAIAALGTGWYFARTYWRIPLEWRQPKLAEVTKGDIRVPITAAGLIEPAERIVIKPQASGEVLEIRVVEGSLVKQGDILVLLNRDDEERNVDRMGSALERAKLNLGTSREEVLKAELTVLVNDARVAELAAQLTSTKYDLEKVKDLIARKLDVSDQQLVDAQARHDVNAAQLESATQQAKLSKSNVVIAGKQVGIGEQAVKEATKNYEDAQERLEETTIRAPQDALVTDVSVTTGEMVQSGTQSLTGGSPMLTLADISKLKVLTRVDESDYGKVHDISPLNALPEVAELRAAAQQDAEQMAKRSGKVTLTVDAFPEDKFDGAIERVEPQGKLNAGASIIQFDVHVQITDEQRFKLPLGAQAQVEFTVESVQDALLVPAEAVKASQSERGVWVQTDEPESGSQWGKRFVRCRFGITDGTNTQVIEVLGPGELKPGDKVYTKLPPRDDD